MNAKTVEKMIEVIEGCMGDDSPYCVTECPMHTNAKKYVKQISDGDYKEAVKTIRDKIFLPKTLGRICTHPCEDACKRNELGHPLSVAALKRYVADKYDKVEDWDLQCAPNRREKVAIIGAGPAGAQAALDLRKKGYQVTIFEKLPVVGGMLYVGIPSYRLPRDIINEEYSYLTKLGVDIRLNTQIGKDVQFNDLMNEYDSIIVAVGAHKGFKLQLPGSDLPGVVIAADFLREVSLTGDFKVDFCPVHLEFLGEVSMSGELKDLTKTVTVIGGGNVALDAARTAARLNVKKVNIVCLERSIDEMFAHNWEVEDAIAEGVELYAGFGINSIEGNGKVEKMNLKKCIQVIDPKGRFNPIYDETDTLELETDVVIFAVGQGVDNEICPDLAFEKNKHFKVDDKTLQTNIRKVFACGESTGISGIAVEAMAEGRIAAESVDLFLNRQDMRKNRVHERAYKTSLDTTIPDDDKNPSRIDTEKMDPKVRVKSFAEVDLGLTDETALEESSRCLQCECRICVKECVMLQEYAPGCPRDLFLDILKKGDVEAIIPFSCNTCGTCTLVCPYEYDIQGAFVEMRRELVEKNKGQSPMKGHKGINMHQFLGFSSFFNTTKGAKTPKGGK